MKTPAEFWKWFGAEQERLAAEDPSAAVDEIHAQLNEVNETLGVEIGAPEDGPLELVFTAGGNAELFDTVRELVAGAPPLEKWTYVALKQAGGFDFTLDLNGAELSPVGWRFHALENAQDPAALGLHLMIPEELLDAENLEWLLWLVIETGLGEEFAVEVQHLQAGPPDEEDKGIEITRLPDYIQWRRSKRN